MATNCVVAGIVECNGQPQAGVNVMVRLLDKNKRATRFSTTVLSDADGDWIAAFDVEFDLAELPFADIRIQCPNGGVRRKIASLTTTRTGVLRQTLSVLFSNIQDALIGKILRLPFITPILSTDFFLLVGSGGKIDCCRQAIVPPTPGGGGAAVGAGGDADAARRAEEAARRAEEERRRAEEERRKAEEERRRAEEERRRAEEERRRAEEERRRAEEAARRAEEAARRAEEALRRLQELQQVRTRMCFDLSGAAEAAGRAGITVAGVSVVTDIQPGDTAEAIMRRLASALQARGFQVRGPQTIPESGEVLLYVIADPTGADPSGGGFGTVDVEGLTRLSAFKQQYRPALLAQLPGAVQTMIGNAKNPLAATTVEVLLLDTDSGRLIARRFDLKGGGKQDVVESILAEVSDVDIELRSDEQGNRWLILTNDLTTAFPVVAIAIEGAQQSIAATVAVDAEAPALWRSA